MSFLHMVPSLHEDMMNLLAQMPRDDENFAPALSTIRKSSEAGVLRQRQLLPPAVADRQPHGASVGRH